MPRFFAAHSTQYAALSFPSHEHPVQFAYRDLEPGRPPVVALAGALGRFHVAQQCVHLGHGERTVGPDCSVAGHGGKHFVLTLGEHPAAAELHDFPQHVAGEFSGVGLGKVCAWSSTVATSSALAVKVAGISNCCVGMRSTSSALLSCS